MNIILICLTISFKAHLLIDSGLSIVYTLDNLERMATAHGRKTQL